MYQVRYQYKKSRFQLYGKVKTANTYTINSSTPAPSSTLAPGVDKVGQPEVASVSRF